jgi:cytochrome P450
MKTPPGPRGRPLIGNLPDFARDLLGFFTVSAREYGDVVRMRLGGRPAWLISDPALIETVLVTRHRDFVKHSWFWRHVTRVFGSGLLTAEGDEWVRHRRLVQPAFHANRIASYADAMVDHTQRMLEGWRDGEERDLHADMMALTMRIVAKVLFDASVESHIARIDRAFEQTLRSVATRYRRPFFIPDWVPIPDNLRYLRGVREMETLIGGFIAEHRTRGTSGDDLLSMLLRARDEEGGSLSDREVRDEAITLFLAGHETTALTLSWAWHLLGRHPDDAKRLHDEADDVLADHDPSAQDVKRLPFTEAVVLESMRLYPPAFAIGREAIRAVELGDYTMPRGTTVFISPWVMHRDPRFFDEPDAFRPARWMDGLAGRISPFVFLPFGLGPRRCIGHRFAMMEAVLLLATMARRVRVEPIGPAPTPFPSITLRPEGGVHVRISVRAAPPAQYSANSSSA